MPHTEVSKKTPGTCAKWPARPPRSAIPACAMIRLTSGVALDESGEVVADRGEPPAAVDQDRHLALDGEREDRVEPLVADREILGPGVQLDPAGSEVEAARRLLDRPSVEVEPDERDDPVGVSAA